MIDYYRLLLEQKHYEISTEFCYSVLDSIKNNIDGLCGVFLDTRLFYADYDSNLVLKYFNNLSKKAETCSTKTLTQYTLCKALLLVQSGIF